MSYGTSYQSSQGLFTGPPPAYSSVAEGSATREPLVGREWENEDDIPDDFKYGVNVSESSLSVRMAFVRKVYSILFAQLFMSTVIGGLMMYNSSIKAWVQESFWAVIVATISSFVLLFILMWKRRSYPINFALLAAFTLAESYTVGTLVTFFEKTIVLNALVITSGLFIGITLFTVQSKYDFSGMFPFLYGCLWLVIILGFVRIFLPFSDGWDFIIAIGTAILFCGFIIYDTFNIMKRTNPEEYVIATVELYLDFINLFIAILRIMNYLSRD